MNRKMNLLMASAMVGMASMGISPQYNPMRLPRVGTKDHEPQSDEDIQNMLSKAEIKRQRKFDKKCNSCRFLVKNCNHHDDCLYFCNHPSNPEDTEGNNRMSICPIFKM